jgi:uncharacterized protein
MKAFLFSLMLFVCLGASSQKKSYADSLLLFQKKYVASHEIIKQPDKKYFRFFPVQRQYRVKAVFERLSDTVGFNIATSGKASKHYFRYGILKFSINNKQLQLTVYQSEQLMKTVEYKDYLFIPFTDLTGGAESYGGGRYIDIVADDLKGNSLLLDFNKCYNPYCAYTTGFNCPIPPRENDLDIAIRVGEMAFGKMH